MKSWLEKLNDPSRDVYERRYRLLSLISIMVLFAWLLIASIVEFHIERVLFFGIGGLLFIPTMIFTLRTGKIQVGAGGSAIVLVFLMLPFAFFYNGGIYAGAPNWCIMAAVFITMTVRGRLRNALLISDLLITTVCYILTYCRPELVASYSTNSAYVDSLASLVITGVIMSSMFLFQMHISRQERDILEAQQTEIRELNRAQNRFFSSMSHEIRTPVNTIIGLNEMILREDVSEEVAQDAEQVQAAGKMLLHLINDILDMSRLESGRMELTESEYELSALLSDIVGMIWLPASQKGLAFHVDVDPSLPSRLVGDEVRIKQILINILNNAIKYTAKGSVTLSVYAREGKETTLVFSVTDTGAGIRKEDIPNLFTAFRRVDEERNRHIEGTGLGLAIVKQLLDLMGGSITVNSVYTKGSTFIVEIPQRVTNAEPVGSMKLKSRLDRSDRHRYVRRFEAPEARVLVVDDSKANLLVVTKLLRETGMRIDTAQSGTEALQKTLTTAYHLILMDHLMPGMDGIECLHQLRAQVGGMSRDAKVVALTANAGSESRRLYAREGFNGYLTKPCTGDELERECMRQLPRELLRIIHGEDAIEEESMSWLKEHDRREELLITTDSIADLPQGLMKRYNIACISHAVRTAEGVFLDGMEVESSGLIYYMRKKGAIAQTLPPTAEEYEAFFAKQISRANHVLHISISGSIPGSGFQIARNAASSFDNVTVFDSGHLSSGQGLLVLEAARMAQKGLSPEAIVSMLEGLREITHTSFIVDKLDNMVQAGLASARAAKLTGTLMIRPVLQMKKGSIRIGRLFLGSRRDAWRRYIASVLRHKAGADRTFLFVTYVGLDEKELDFIRKEIEKHAAFEHVIFQKASPAIGVNCGPGTFGLLYQYSVGTGESPAALDADL